MELSEKSKIGSLVKNYPFLIDYLVGFSPKFSKLKNPVLRKTLANFATVSNAASMADVDISDLISGIAVEIFKNTNENIILINPGGKKEGNEDSLKKERIKTFKAIVMRIHNGESPEDLKEEFHDLLRDVSPAEIGAMEQELVADGIPETEIKKLCSLHVELFTSDSKKPDLPVFPKGHPVESFRKENSMADEKASEIFKAAGGIIDEFGFFAAKNGLKDGVMELANMIRHYERKENQLFPIMEKYELTAPPQVMWEIHDEIRKMFKTAILDLEGSDYSNAVKSVSELMISIKDMVFKEEQILLPMVVEVFSEEDWKKVRIGESEIGFAWIDPGDEWLPHEDEILKPEKITRGLIRLDEGSLSPDVINSILKHLPVDMTFVDSNDHVAYFSQTRDRIFPRSAGIIGREVSKCHPPKSVHIVEEILLKFKKGERDNAKFWIELGGNFIFIQYFAVRKNGEYLGCLEVSQNVTEIRSLEGEQRLLDWS